MARKAGIQVNLLEIITWDFRRSGLTEKENEHDAIPCIYPRSVLVHRQRN